MEHAYNHKLNMLREILGKKAKLLGKIGKSLGEIAGLNENADNLETMEKIRTKLNELMKLLDKYKRIKEDETKIIKEIRIHSDSIPKKQKILCLKEYQSQTKN